jgi:hypothetical protein
MNLFIGGSLRDVPQYQDVCSAFVAALGKEAIRRGHTVLTGCSGSLDKAVAEAAYTALGADAAKARLQLVSYRLKEAEPAHRLGRVQISRRADWELSHPELDPPEQIAEADVTIFIAGRKGTYSAANWARIARKPILGVAQFGGAGAVLFDRERVRFAEQYARSLTIDVFDLLGQDTADVERLASDVIDVAEKLISSRTVFAIMSFKETFREVFESYRAVFEPMYEVERTDDLHTTDRIIPRILDGIRGSAFVVADVTELSGNVLYEIGFAQGLGKRVIVTARQGTTMPFDLVDLPVIFWSDQDQLKNQLRQRLAGLTSAANR